MNELPTFAQLGIQGLCLVMMFWLCRFILSRVVKVIDRLDRSIVRLTIQLIRLQGDKTNEQILAEHSHQGCPDNPE